MDRRLNQTSGAIGIDFGTSKSCVAVFESGTPVVIADSRGHRTLPSVVLVDPDDKLHIGWDAINNPLRYQSRSFTISSVKRLMGSAEQVQWGTLKTYPQEISALVIALLKSLADLHCGRATEFVVIAVPAHYDIHQRWATLQAAEIAGFSNVRLVNEATAAVLAYKNNNEVDESVLVFDFGAGTLDVSVVEYGEGVAEVKASAGDDRLGGDDFDQVITRFALDWIEKQIGKVDLTTLQMLVLSEAAHQAKLDLSAGPDATLYLPGFVRTHSRSFDLNVRLERVTFENLTTPLLERAQQVLKQVCKDGGLLSGTKPSKLLLIGGTSRIPCVRSMVKQVVGLEPISGLDPESGVCEGACILASVLKGEVRDHLLLLDVTPMTLSIETRGGVSTQMIPRNTTIPTKKAEPFTTTQDNQTELTVRIYQGEKPMTSQNSFVGQVRLSGLPQAKAGTPAIEVCFEVDANGTLRVSATDRATGKNVAAILESPYRLNPAQLKVLQRKVDREISAIRDAEARRRELEAQAGAKADAQRLSEAVGRFLHQYGDQLPSDSKSLLASGGGVVREYVAANASAGDMSILMGSLRSTFEDAVLGLVVGQLRSATESEAFTRWQHCASGRRTKTDCLSAIGELSRVSEVELEEIASFLRITNIPADKILAAVPPKSAAGAIFILTQFFGFKPDAAHFAVMRETDRELLRLLLLAQLARESRAHFGPVARSFLRDEFTETSCLFLLEYLLPTTDLDVRTAVEECVGRVPSGTWRRAWQERDYESTFVCENSIGRREVVREILEALRVTNNRELQLVALNDARRIGVESCIPTIFDVVCLPHDSQVKLGLLGLLQHCQQPEVIQILFQAIADERSDVSKAAISALLERKFEVPRELESLLRIAQKVVEDHGRPTLTERIALWRVVRRHRNFRGLVQFLLKRHHTNTESVH